MRNKFLFLLTLSFLYSCSNSKDHLFQELHSGKTGVNFKNILRESPEFNVLKYSYFYNGGGVAVGDVNNDGLPDIYFTGNLVASHLYLNKGNMKFENIAQAAGVEAAGLWNTGVTMADVNNDGWLDIYVCRSAAADPNGRRNLLFINNHLDEASGTVTFTEQGRDFGVDDPAYSTQAAFFDYDRDGDLDLFLLNHSVPEYSGFQTTIGSFKKISNPFYGNKLYRNNGNQFKDVSSEANIVNNVLSFGLGVAIADFNNDSWPDIYVSNDFNEEDYLYINQQDGTFLESIRNQADHTSLFSMGSDAADVNNDGAMDLITLDMLPKDNFREKMTSGADNFDKYQLLRNQGFFQQNMRNMLQMNQGDGTFQEVGQFSGISNTDWSWSALFADFDLNGWQDLFVTNGYLKDYTNMDFLAYAVDTKLKNDKAGAQASVEELLSKMPQIAVNNVMFQNQNGYEFKEVSKDWGFDAPYLSNGAAYGDFDNDGDLDLVVNNVNEKASVYKNSAIEKDLGFFLKIKPVGSNGIGLKAIAFSAGQKFARELFVSRGFQSAIEPLLFFGFPKSSPATLDSILITWPDGAVYKYQQVPVNTVLEVSKSDPERIVTPASPGKVFEIFKKEYLIDFTHQENAFNDFKVQSLLPWFYSQTGPPITIGDFNGDGHSDVFVGGAAGQSSALFKGNSRGSLERMEVPDLKALEKYECTDAKFADIDGDQDLDLIVVSGGNSFEAGQNHYPVAILKNDRGQFFRVNTLSPIDICATSLDLADIDLDGDLDIFIGSSYQPWRFPYPEANLILLNNGIGDFSMAPEQMIPEGIVMDATFADMDMDGSPELITAGEWGAVTIWKQESGNWKKWAASLEKGWWNALLVANLDDDPEPEIVAGNFGMNSQFRASKEQPISLFYKDFDGNGSVDPLLAQYNGKQRYPFIPRDDLFQQLPQLKKLFPDYYSYANATIDFILDQFGDCDSLSVNYLKSVVFDLQNGGLSAHPLPDAAQFAPVFAMETLDFDADGDIDLVMAGNQTNVRVKIGELDANHGLLLENKGGLSFEPVKNTVSGLNLKGNVRSCKVLEMENQKYLLFGVNDQKVVTYRWQKNNRTVQ